MVNLREFVKSVATILPEVPKPKQKPALSEKFVWTGLAMTLYFVMAITPLYQYREPYGPARRAEDHLRI